MAYPYAAQPRGPDPFPTARHFVEHAGLRVAFDPGSDLLRTCVVDSGGHVDGSGVVGHEGEDVVSVSLIVPHASQ